jgi:hypothetical protein
MHQPYKFFSSAVLLLLFVSIGVAQIPNAGFEQWSGGNPVSWTTNNVPTVATPVTQSSTSHSGTSAVRGEVLSVFGSPYSPLLFSEAGGNGFPVSQRHANLTGYYRLTPVSTDALIITVVMSKAGVGIGAGSVILRSAGTYTQFSAPIFYGNAQVPDTCLIEIIVADTASSGAHVGSVMFVDDLAFQGVNGVDEGEHVPQAFLLEQNYPNPFNPSTQLNFDLPEATNVSLVVYDVLGRKVTELANAFYDAGRHSAVWNAKDEASGVYFARFTATKRSGELAYSKVNRLVLMK